MKTIKGFENEDIKVSDFGEWVGKDYIDYKFEYKNNQKLIKTLFEENQELKKQLEERDKWLIICILELMKEYKTDTVWITNQQIENVKDKNISYEVYGGNDIKFYQNIKK